MSDDKPINDNRDPRIKGRSPVDMCLPNMTATEVMNAECPPFPAHGSIGDMLQREAKQFGLVLTHQTLTPAECLALWGRPE